MQKRIRDGEFNPHDFIVGFSYSFSHKILGFLKSGGYKGWFDSEFDLNKENRERATLPTSRLAPGVSTTFAYLAQQMCEESPIHGRDFWQDEAKGLIESAEKFLAIFEKKRPKKINQKNLAGEIESIIARNDDTPHSAALQIIALFEE